MKEITKKILESGLVGPDLAMAMEKWGNLERGSSDVVGTRPVTAATSGDFAAELALLVNRDEPLRETVLDLYSSDGDEYIVVSPNRKAVYGVFDNMGNLIVGEKAHFASGDIVAIHKKGRPGQHAIYEVFDFEKIYNDEKVIAHRLVLNMKR